VNLFVYALILIAIIRFMPTGLLGWFSASSIKAKFDKTLGLGKQRVGTGGEGR
jgi:hypothetical protein